jgi:hypothetical protein
LFSYATVVVLGKKIKARPHKYNIVIELAKNSTILSASRVFT